jgi:DNA-binding HxlR family transcriptional regulator
MRTYREYCPIAKGAEVIGERWNLLIFREMLAGVTRFNELQRLLPGISRSVLAQRLEQLTRVGVITRTPGTARAREYVLTAAGTELSEIVTAVGAWAARWAFPDPDALEMNPLLVMVWLTRHLNRPALPDRRVVIRFELSGGESGLFWLVLEPGDPSLCLKHPGYDEDVEVEADTATMYDIYFGRLALAEAMKMGRVRVEGLPRDLRVFPSWFGPSKFASMIRSRRIER